VKLAPARISPIFVPRIWGARTLAPLFTNPPGISEPIGEVWLTGDTCEFASGPFSGRSLAQSWASMPGAWCGTRLLGCERIPLLVKFIFPEDKLSVQVHPDDDYARKHESAAGGVGKTEMWYALSARENAALHLGFEAGVTREVFCRAIAEGSAERCLKQVAVRPGDAFFVPAGTVHTIGPGMLICEIQQNSDVTYRVFDYNRLQADGAPRALHLEKALQVLHFGEPQGRKIDPLHTKNGDLKQTYLAACRHFATELWEFSGPVIGASSPARFELLIALHGHGRIESSADPAEYNAGELWLIPAALGKYRLVPNSATSLLRTYVPDLSEFVQHLRSLGIEEMRWSRVVHP